MSSPDLNLTQRQGQVLEYFRNLFLLKLHGYYSNPEKFLNQPANLPTYHTSLEFDD